MSAQNVELTPTPLLDRIGRPQDLHAMTNGELEALAIEVRAELVRVVFETGGHLASNLGTVELTMSAAGVLDHRCGREALHLIKVTGSSFAGFVRDRYTALPETRDRPLFIHLNVYWRHPSFDERVPTRQVRGVVTETFDTFESRSIQHLVHEMGQRILQRFPAVVEVSFDAENRTWDGIAIRPSAGAQRAVYADPRPPFGVIGLTLTR